MFDSFMQELADFLVEARLATQQEIRGATEEELQQLETHLGRMFPASFVAFFRQMGHGAGKLMDCDPLTISGLKNAREVAEELTGQTYCEWQLTADIFPLSQHHGYTFTFIPMDAGDDPPVYYYTEGDPRPLMTSIAFSAWIREMALWEVECKPWNAEICREIERCRTAEAWLARKAILDHYGQQVDEIRRKLIERIDRQDKACGAITGPTRFQERWVRTFYTTPLYKQLMKEGKRMPWGWITPAQAGREEAIV